tara:strand:+ start:9729 stop:10646 length:918 start_codon:yes stop_codon:yes gene_type:complete
MLCKNKSFLVSLFLFNIFCVCAQDLDSTRLDTLKSNNWKLKSLYSLNGAQSSFVNWNAGGRNNISLNASVRASAIFNQEMWNWSSDLSLAFGGIKYLDNSDILMYQKTDDKIDLSSKLGVRISEKFLISLNTGFKTQFADGFTYPNDSIAVSKFMAPGYMNLALGSDYVKGTNFSVFGSPFAAKTTFVMDDSLSQIGSFGVEKGSRIRHEFGAFLKLKWNAELMKNIEMKSKLELFSNYLNNPQNIDVNAELVFVFRVNSLFSATAQWNLIYDDDIQIRDINGNVGPRTQFKSVLGIGLSYKLEN